MGEKGDKMKMESVMAAETLIEKLSEIKDVSSKKMFGGHGLFCKGKMFGLIDSKGQSFLKIDDALKAELESKGAVQHSRMPYYSIPDPVLNNDSELLAFARRSIALTK